MDILKEILPKDKWTTNNKKWIAKNLIKSTLVYGIIIILLTIGALLQEQSVVDTTDPYYYLSIVVGIVAMYIAIIVYIVLGYKRLVFFVGENEIMQIQGVLSKKKVVFKSENIESVEQKNDFIDNILGTKTIIIKGKETQQDTQGGVFSYNEDVIMKITI